MKCPKCASARFGVRDSRDTSVTDRNDAVRRRRVCFDCNHRWTTLEIDITYVKMIRKASLGDTAEVLRRIADMIESATNVNPEAFTDA